METTEPIAPSVPEAGRLSQVRTGGLPAQRTGSSFGRAGIMFAAGSIVGKAISLALLPILTRFLGPSELGRLDLLSILTSSAISMLSIGLDVGATRRYFDVAPGRDRRRVIAAWYLIGGVIALAAFVTMLWLAEPLALLLFGSQRFAFAVRIVGICILVGTTNVVGLNAMRLRPAPGPYAIVSAGSLLIYTIGSFVLLSLVGPRLESVLLALSVAWGMSSLVSFVYVRADAWEMPTLREVGAILRLSIPAAPALVATWAAEFLYRAVLLQETSAAELAQLSVALRLASAALLIVTAFQLAWQPRAYMRGSSNRAMSVTWQEAQLALAALGATLVALAFIGPIVPTLLGSSSYAPAVSILGPALVAVAGSALVLVLSMPSLLHRATWHVGMASAAGMAVGTAANLVLAEPYAGMGTAWSMAIAQLTSAIVVALLGWRADCPAVPMRVLIVLLPAVSATILLTGPGLGMSFIIRSGVALPLLLIYVPLVHRWLRSVSFIGSEGTGISHA